MASASDILQELEEIGEEGTFDVPIGKDKITFRRPADAMESHRIRAWAEKQVTAIQKTPSPVYKPYQSYAADVIRQACWLHKLAQEPPFTFVEALDMAKHGAALAYLHQSIVQGIGSAIVAMEVEEIEEAKNG